MYKYKLQRDNHEPKCSAYRCAYRCAYYSTNRPQTTLFCCLKTSAARAATGLHMQLAHRYVQLRFATNVAAGTPPVRESHRHPHIAMYAMQNILTIVFVA